MRDFNTGLVFILKIFLPLCLLVSHQVFAQSSAYRFAQVTTKDGLTHNQVNCILKDSKGFLWFGTAKGLNRYDGYSFKQLQHDPRDTSTIRDNFIENISEDPNGRIWIDTRAGTCIYDPVEDRVTRNQEIILNQYGIKNDLVSTIFHDSHNNYWFISDASGFYKYSPGSKKTDHFISSHTSKNSIHGATVSALVEEKNADFWIFYIDGMLEKFNPPSGTVVERNSYFQQKYPGKKLYVQLLVDQDNDLWIREYTIPGIHLYNTQQRSFTVINTTSTGIRLNNNMITGMTQDDAGLVWIITDHGGINIVNKKTGHVQYLLHHDDDPQSVSHNSLLSIYKDNAGIIWIGTSKMGINYYHDDIFRFRHYKHYVSDPLSLPFNDVNCFTEDDRGNVWIGTNGGGLVYFDRVKNTFEQFLHNPNNPASLSNNVVVSTTLDHKKRLWVGTFLGGLNSYNGKKFTPYKHEPKNSKSIADNSVWKILEDRKQNLWIATLSKGLDILDQNTNEFIHYQNGAISNIHSPYISTILEDRENNLWIGTAYGLDVLNLESGILIHYEYSHSKPSAGLSQNNVTCLLEDSRGLIWVGTREGLNYFDKKKGTFGLLTKDDGLPDNSILAVLEDNEQNLWASTPNGLSTISVGTKDGALNFSFNNFDEFDGLQANDFNSAAYKTSKGELLFGGPNGFNIFIPNKISINKMPLKAIITDFQVFNKSISSHEELNGRKIIKKSITFTDGVTLKYNENAITFEFAALSFLHPEKNKFSYTLEGFDKGWSITDSKHRRATYTNLDPGTYTFRVKVSNASGQWNEPGAYLKIILLPPLWKTGWAMACYGLFALLILAGGFVLYNRSVLAPQQLQLKLEQERRESERMHELDALKIKFFTNVSHEFRTPLTLVITPLESIIKTVQDQELKKQLNLVQRNAKRLLGLVNQLLDFRKMEVKEFKLNLASGDLIACIRETVNSFSDLSEHKNINLSFYTGVSVLETNFDQDKIEKILFNLLSNAFKFTPEGGSVAVSVTLAYTAQEADADYKQLELKVKDSGIGIPTENKTLIFERFFQNELPNTIINQGSGIGLAITKEFVKLHGGTITVESEVGLGSTFTITLPVAEITSLSSTYDAVPEKINVTATDSKTIEPTVYDTKKPLLLLVEDNEDFRFYLKDNLKLTYQVIEAINGNDGWKQTFTLIPDLIVSDIMMPGLNGLQLCVKIKNDIRTSHIPVILLTARATEEQKLEGFEAGANDYITKPFNVEILQSRIRNILIQQNRIQQNNRTIMDVNPSKMEVSSLDQKLIEKAVKLVENNMGTPEFSVVDLGKELGMSRSNLYKKIISITGKSPLEFIRILRLKRGAQLLKESQLSVSEIAYQVGFNNPRYFSQHFKEEFGVLPSDFKKNG